MTEDLNDILLEEELDSTALGGGVEHEQDEGLEIHSPFDPTDIDIKTKNPSVDTLMKRLDHDEIDLNPGFQRKGGIWSNVRKSRLIESLLLNIPLPVFYVASDAEGDWIVVDGLQRLTALNQFIREQSFSLEGMEFLHQFNGKTFDALPRPMQRRIQESEPVFHIIQPGCPKAVTRTIFKRINTSGMPLSAQEIRHALYEGPATRLLHELASTDAFIKATGGSIKDDRMADRECVLRYLAFEVRGIGEYKVSDLDAFLSETLEILNATDHGTLDAYRERFERAMTLAFRIFGEQAFRKQRRKGQRKYPINKGLFETWGVALSDLDVRQANALVDQRARLNDRFIDLLETDADFVSAISATTGSMRSVHVRFERIKNLIDSLLEVSP